MTAIRIVLLVVVCALSLPLKAEPGLGDEAYGLLKSMYAYDATFPLNVRTAGRFEREGAQFERLVFESFHGGNATGLLGLPAGEGPFPIVILMHGVTGSKSQWLDDAFTNGGLVSAGLLAKGYAVLALDAQYHGDRAVYNDYIDVGEMVFQRGWGVRYANLLTQTVVDYRRAIDYLATREDIDVTRLGALGYSMGGHMAFILGALEPRIQATVACVVPHMAGMPMTPYAFARDMGADPLLMLMGTQDRFYTREQAQALFDLVPGDNKTLHFYDSGHSLPAEYTDKAVNWLSEQL
ncbi:MAG: alpha/beta fold hydrolase [Pseudomonadales bacterium]